MIYSHQAEPDLSKYFDSYEVKKSIHWTPAISIPGGDFVPQKLGRNVYLASDYNISGLEDAYLTGLYAANEIIAQSPS